MTRKKKIVIPQTIQSKFKRSQYKVGDVVYFYWLSEAKYGEILKVDKSNETVTYKVKDMAGTIYRVGIKIKEFKSYEFGVIDFDKTKEIGQSKLKKKYSGEA